MQDVEKGRKRKKQTLRKKERKAKEQGVKSVKVKVKVKKVKKVGKRKKIRSTPLLRGAITANVTFLYFDTSVLLYFYRRSAMDLYLNQKTGAMTGAVTRGGQ